jgi:hypothetical protein
LLLILYNSQFRPVQCSAFISFLFDSRRSFNPRGIFWKFRPVIQNYHRVWFYQSDLSCPSCRFLNFWVHILLP